MLVRLGRSRYTRTVTLPLSLLVHQSDRRVYDVIKKYRIGALNETNVTGSFRYNAIVYGGHQPARCTLEVKEQSVESPVKVQCSCKYFTMNLETVLAVYGVSKPAQAEGILPTQRNPTMKPGLCPHLYLLALHLGKEWSSGNEKDKKKQKEVDVNDQITERDL